MPEIEISAMTFGPFGVGRHEGKAVMVPGAVAGDKLSVDRFGAARLRSREDSRDRQRER
jgi:tRNA/tmRNA/rRNA uracil-C5-methylase (TrmA/RlmC/RlmD family)